MNEKKKEENKRWNQKKKPNENQQQHSSRNSQKKKEGRHQIRSKYSQNTWNSSTKSEHNMKWRNHVNVCSLLIYIKIIPNTEYHQHIAHSQRSTLYMVSGVKAKMNSV